MWFIGEKIWKYPSAFYKVSYMLAAEMVTSLLGPIQQCVQQEPSSVAGMELHHLWVNLFSSARCNSGKLYFSVSLSPLSSYKISAGLTGAFTYNTSTGQGPFSREEMERLDFSSKGCSSSLQSSMQKYFSLAFSRLGHRTSPDVSFFLSGE